MSKRYIFVVRGAGRYEIGQKEYVLVLLEGNINERFVCNLFSSHSQLKTVLRLVFAPITAFGFALGVDFIFVHLVLLIDPLFNMVSSPELATGRTIIMMYTVCVLSARFLFEETLVLIRYFGTYEWLWLCRVSEVSEAIRRIPVVRPGSPLQRRLSEQYRLPEPIEYDLEGFRTVETGDYCVGEPLPDDLRLAPRDEVVLRVWATDDCRVEYAEFDRVVEEVSA